MITAGRALTYVGTSRIDGPLLVVEKPFDVGFDETVEVQDPSGAYRLGRVLDVSQREAVVQVLEGTVGQRIAREIPERLRAIERLTCAHKMSAQPRVKLVRRRNRLLEVIGVSRHQLLNVARLGT